MKTRTTFIAIFALTLTLPPVGLMLAQQARIDRNAAVPRPQGPGDIYAANGTPCVAAHSTTRALFESYNGPLYQVTRQSDTKTLDIGVVPPSANDGGGYADAAAQDAFCEGTLCVFSTLYDQSGKENHLVQAPPGTFPGPAKGGFDTLPIADMAPITVMGHKVYGVYFMPGMGFRNNNASGIAINDEAEGIYYVIDGKHYSSGCCFDYGNSSTNGRAVGTGTMETTYYGTATAWGSGSGRGPWIMSDMEAGLFSGYNAKQNAADPTIDSWRFVTAVVDGGGGNKWDLRGGNAQEGGLTTFYSGIRPGSETNDRYFPMHKQGGILLGTGGDNGNGSAGTFYEGIITTGYPTEATTDAVQANIVASRYDVSQMSLSRLKTFTPGSTQEFSESFTNTTGSPATGVKLSVSLPAGWTAAVADTTESSKSFTDPVVAGATVSATFNITSPAKTGAGFVTGRANWTNSTTGAAQSETATQRLRNVFPIKINEVQFATGANQNNQFIELFNAGDTDIDLSAWSLVSTQSQWPPIKLATIPPGTKLARGSHYLLGLAQSGLTAPASAGESTINVRSTTGFEAGQQTDVDGESRKVTNVGTASTPMTTVFIPVSTGPWLLIPAGATNLPVTDATGFVVGEKIGIDIGGNYEVATVTVAGKAATQTTLLADAAAKASSIKIESSSNITDGDTLIVDTGSRKETVKVKNVSQSAPRGTTPDSAIPPGNRRGGNRGSAIAADLELAAPLQLDHVSGVDVSGVGTGISFAPATKFPHRSGDAVQALGSGITLDSALANNHTYGAPVINSQVTTGGYQGPPAPNQWFGATFSPRAGSITLVDASGNVIVDAIVYGSQQSSSSANGTITTPEIATLEGDQHQGGRIFVVPNIGGRGRGRGAQAGAAPAPSRSAGRTSNGIDTDSNFDDFQLQAPTPGAQNKNLQ